VQSIPPLDFSFYVPRHTPYASPISAKLTAELSALSPEEKLEVIEALWESIDFDSEIPVPAWHLEELRRRAARHPDPGSNGTPWPEVKARLLAGNA